MAQKLGFLSVRQHAEHGYFGGYLILNQLARPLEFHCTMPVKTSRAQELLYGPTLNDFVCGEQIAKALVTKAKLQPDVLLTDTPAVLGLGHVSTTDPILVVCESETSTTMRLLETPLSNVLPKTIVIGETRLGVRDGSSHNESSLTVLLESVGPNFDLAEPFQRIAEAIVEAHPIAKAA